MNGIRPRVRAALVSLMLVGMPTAAPTAAQTPAQAPMLKDQVLVVSSNQPAFADAARGAMAALGDQGVLMNVDATSKLALAASSGVIAVGPLAERAVSKAMEGMRVPAVFCLSPRVPAGGVGVPILPAATEVLAFVTGAFPTVRTVGLFSLDDVDATDAATAAGITLLRPNSGEAFDSAVDRLVANSDVVWVRSAQAVPNGAAAVLVKRALDAQKVIIGPNRTWVSEGALAALVPDPVEHGRAAARIVVGLLAKEGSQPDTITSRLVLNAPLARTFQVVVPPAWSRRTDHVQ